MEFELLVELFELSDEEQSVIVEKLGFQQLLQCFRFPLGFVNVLEPVLPLDYQTAPELLTVVPDGMHQETLLTEVLFF